MGELQFNAKVFQEILRLVDIFLRTHSATGAFLEFTIISGSQMGGNVRWAVDMHDESFEEAWNGLTDLKQIVRRIYAESMED